jgi:hypothetical protein
MGVWLNKILRSEKGQSLIEISLIAPLMLLLAYGAVEVGSVISTHLTMTHTTREGANLTARGTDPDTALDAIILAAAPTLRAANNAQWRVIYTRVRQDPTVPCLAPPCTFIVDNIDPKGQVVRGGLPQSSKVGTLGSQVTQAQLPGIEGIQPNQGFHVIEVFYDYAPDILTFVGKGINTDFYERAVFTNVSTN